MGAVSLVRAGGNCERCGGIGFVRVKFRYPDDHVFYPGEEGEKSVPCDCRVKEAIRKAAGLSPSFERKTFRNFALVGVPEAVRGAYKLAAAYVSRWDQFGARGGGLLLLGASGSGKTHLLCAVVNELVERKVRVVYVPYVEAMAELRRRRFDDEWQAKRRAAWKACDLLVIDDLFKVEPDKYAFEVLFEVVNDRYFNGKPVAVSSEWTPDELLEFDAAIAGRLLEQARGHVAVLRHPDGDNLALNYRLRR